MDAAREPRSHYDVAVIGAGPAGTTGAALLRSSGLDVAVFERARFPRFAIGESLLPSCNEVLREAKLFERVQAQGYQVKTGAVFQRGDQRCAFDFGDQFSAGWGWTWQVPRADFDRVLAEGVQEQGVPIFFGNAVSDVRVGPEPALTVTDEAGTEREVRCRFVVDASGPGRVLPRLLGLEEASGQPRRSALFAHVEGDRRLEGADAGRIHIIVHRPDVWFWIIPFSDGRTSVGVVAPEAFFSGLPGEPADRLRALIEAEPHAAARLGGAEFVLGPSSIDGYSVASREFYGEGFCLVGNATEFLDPVFSSGVALALESARLSAAAIARQLRGEPVDWRAEYGDPMRAGIDTFRTFVNAWYDGTLHRIFFARSPNADYKRMICSALAGYVWDRENPFVRHHARKLKQLSRLVDNAD